MFKPQSACPQLFTQLLYYTIYQSESLVENNNVHQIPPLLRYHVKRSSEKTEAHMQLEGSPITKHQILHVTFLSISHSRPSYKALSAAASLYIAHSAHPKTNLTRTHELQ